MAQDPYVKRLRQILKKAGSPLAPYAGFIARMEAKYGIPRGYIAAIARAESSYGTAGDPVRYHNAWGWTAGGPPNWRKFPSWKAAIREYAKFLSSNYISQGLDTPEKMMRRYVGYDAPDWVRNFRSTLDALGVPAGGSPPKSRNPRPGAGKGNRQPEQFDQWDPASNKDARELILGGIMLNLSAMSQGAQPPFNLAGALLSLRMQGLDGGLFDDPRKSGVKASSKASMAVGSGLRYTSAGGTHQTSGLAGFPAIDFMASGGTPVYAPAAGVIPKDRPYGKNPRQDPAAGFGGSRIYFRGQLDKDPELEELFITHLGKLAVKPGQKVKKGQLLGYVWHWPGDPGRSHAHIGIKGAPTSLLFKLFPKKGKKKNKRR